MTYDIEQLADPVAALDEFVVLRTAWAAEQDRPLVPGDPFVDDLRTWLEREASHRQFWLIRLNDQPVGMVNLLVFDRMPTVGIPGGGWGYLCNMFVDTDHRNGGLGARLAEAVLAYADTTGLERVVLSPSERSRPFYGSLGFTTADKLLVRTRSGSP